MEHFRCSHCGAIVRKAYLIQVTIDDDRMTFGYPCMKCKILYAQNDTPMLDACGNQCFLVNQKCVIKDKDGNVIFTTQATVALVECFQ